MGGMSSIATALPNLKRFLELPEDQTLTLFKCTPDTLVPTDKNLAPLEHIGSPACCMAIRTNSPSISTVSPPFILYWRSFLMRTVPCKHVDYERPRI